MEKYLKIIELIDCMELKQSLSAFLLYVFFNPFNIKYLRFDSKLAHWVKYDLYEDEKYINFITKLMIYKKDNYADEHV